MLPLFQKSCFIYILPEPLHIHQFIYLHFYAHHPINTALHEIKCSFEKEPYILIEVLLVFF